LCLVLYVLRYCVSKLGMSSSVIGSHPVIGTLLFGGIMASYVGLKVLYPLSEKLVEEYKHPRNEYVKSKPKVERFPEAATDWDGALTYFRNRTTQGLADGLCLLDVVPVDLWGAMATFSVEPVNTVVDKGGASARVYHSVYVYESHRGKGHYSRWMKENPDKVIITTADCNLAPFLASRGREYELKDPSALQWPEYRLALQFYGDHCAARTGLHFMNHVDEGLFVLRSSAVKGCSEAAMRAYVLHPLVQGDEECASFLRRLSDKGNPADPVHSIDPLVIALAIEYRSFANGYLSPNHADYFEGHRSGGDGVRLSPCKDVNDMLIADKVQNRKDFDLMHAQSHPKAALLSSYFDAWLHKLGVSKAKYDEIRHELLRRVYGSAGNPADRAIAAVQQYALKHGAQL
jgi:GNAT superfamily N-acetyltransferase